MSKFTRGVVITLSVLLALYFIAYLFVVQRVVSPSAPENPSDGVLTQDVKVIASFRGHLGYLIFSPANKFDRSFIRRHYWSDWTVVESNEGKSINYVVDE